MHDEKTISELVVLALYGQSISHPYVKAMRIAEKNKVNMLDLGPLHNKVRNHMKKLIAYPDLLLDSEIAFENAELNGEEWRAVDGMQRISELIPRLPHVRPLLLAFLQGALETWKRFTSEFAPGSLIDEATVEEKEMAWMPGTNDVNEGALGSFRSLMRRQPCLSILQYNAQAMYFHNNTAAFMSKFFKDEDYKYIHKLARAADGLKTAGLTVQKRKIAMIADAVLYHAGTWKPFTEADQSDSDLEEMIDNDVSDTEDEWEDL